MANSSTIPLPATSAPEGSLLSKERIIARPGFNRWLVPPAALAIHLCIGMAYGFSVFWLPLSMAVGINAPIACGPEMGFFARITSASCDWQISELQWMYTLFFVLLGCFLDGISMVVLTTSVVMPMVQAAGIDPLWFGIYIVLVVEMAQITPPVGFNLTVIQRLTGDSMGRITRATMPFFYIMSAFVLLIAVFPGIIDLLPGMMAGR